jgi:pimeloyl-ACP methyl ester carboxylesterase
MQKNLLLTCFLFFFTLNVAHAVPQWLTLPPTPSLLKPEKSGYAPINNVRIWYAIYGHGQPVILLHGGLSNSNSWGNQIPVLAKHYQVIVMDSRGHGRSTRNAEPYSYNLMASDVIGLMDYLKIKKAAIVGWSDGGIIGLDMAINHPERMTKLFAYAANSDPSGVNPDVAKSPVFNTYKDRTIAEYEKLSPTPKDYKIFRDQISKMWGTQPHFTKEQLNSIKVPTWIVNGDHDEFVTRANTVFMAEQIPNAGLLLEAWVSHFGFLQDPKQFNDDVLHFLEIKDQP